MEAQPFQSTKKGGENVGPTMVKDSIATCAREASSSRSGTARAEHPDYEPDLNFKKAKAEKSAEQQELL